MTGIYRCEILCGTDITQPLFIGVFTANTGECTCSKTELVNISSETYLGIFAYRVLAMEYIRYQGWQVKTGEAEAGS